MATHRTVASCLVTGNTKLPLRRTNSKPSIITNNINKFNNINNNNNANNKINSKVNNEADKWRCKYEEAEIKRKQLLSDREKARRSILELEKRNSHLQIKNEEAETELFEKNESLTKLTTASKSLFKEYDALKNKYEVETGAMNRALTDASQWYRENKVLRRRTMLMDADNIDEGVDSYVSGSDTDLDNLKESVKNLSSEVAHLQSELNAAKLLEFEITESNIHLTHELEEERTRNEKIQADLKELNQSHDQLIRVSNMMRKELEDLKEMVSNHKNNADIFKREADDYKKERNVLAHQSTILLQGLKLEEGIDSLLLMQEIEELKSNLEDERSKHREEIESLQDKIEDNESNSHVEILEERLKLVESELQHALERAQKAEQANKAPPPPAPPLPPPPPPPPALPQQTPVVPLRIKKLSRTSPPLPVENQDNDETAMDKKGASSVNGVNDEIINQIKGGFFTLRKARSENKNKDREAPKAVSEMLNILGSLRRTTKNTKVTLSQPANYRDVQV